MSEIPKISILSKTDTKDFKQLETLLKKFIIDTYVRNKQEFSSLKGKNKIELVNNAINEFDGKHELSVLSKQEIEELTKNIEFQIDTAKKEIQNSTDKNIQTRYYILKDQDKVVSFQQVQISKSKQPQLIEGWRNLAYSEPEYAGKNGSIIDSKGNIQQGIYNELIYEDVENWFNENNVNYERTCTGVNMLPNILAYIKAKKFVPFSKNSETIFLEKYKDKEISSSTATKIYIQYHENLIRNQSKTQDEILETIQNTKEFDELSEEQKAGLVQCYLKEDEKQFTLSPEKMEMLNNYIQLTIESLDKNTDYNFIHNLSKIAIKEFKKPIINAPPSIKSFTPEQSIKIASDFIENNKLSTLSDIPSNTKFKGNIKDVYSIIHQVYSKDLPDSSLMSEAIPQCFESMLSKYLVEQGISTSSDISAIEKEKILEHYTSSAETFFKLELAKIKEQNGTISLNDINQLKISNNISDEQLNSGFALLASSNPSINSSAKYMISNFIYPELLKQYSNDPEKAKKTLNEIIKEPNDLNNTLNALNISHDTKGILTLIQSANEQIETLDEFEKPHTQMKEVAKNGICRERISDDEVKKALQVENKELSKDTKTL